MSAFDNLTTTVQLKLDPQTSYIFSSLSYNQHWIQRVALTWGGNAPVTMQGLGRGIGMQVTNSTDYIIPIKTGAAGVILNVAFSYTEDVYDFYAPSVQIQNWRTDQGYNSMGFLTRVDGEDPQQVNTFATLTNLSKSAQPHSADDLNAMMARMRKNFDDVSADKTGIVRTPRAPRD